jgi:hypothetical protein
MQQRFEGTRRLNRLFAALQTEAVDFLGTVVSIMQTTWCYIPEISNFDTKISLQMQASYST